MAKSLFERIINRMIPLDRDYKALVRERTAYIKARREWFELQNREEREKVERELEEQKKQITVGVMETPGLSMVDSDGKRRDVSFQLILKESKLARHIKVVAHWDDQRSPIVDEGRLNRIVTWASNQDYYTAWVRPWMEGVLEVEDLDKLSFFRVPGEFKDAKKKKAKDADKAA